MIDMKPYRVGASSVWFVWPDGDDFADARRVRAFDAEEAAEVYAAWDDMNSAEYSVLRGNEVTVFVRLEGSDEDPERFMVRGESVPTYTARQA